MPKIKTVRGIENRKVSQKEWLVARKKLLLKEKKFSKLRDELNLQRRRLPWVKIEKEYVFGGPSGKVTLADLFNGKSQLIVYHFMLGPGWGEGCEHCSFWADHFDSVNIHIGQRDMAFAVVSRAPLKEIDPFKKRMGWQFRWVSSFDTDFNFDFNVSFTPEQIKSRKAIYNFAPLGMDIDEREGVSAFYKDMGHVGLTPQHVHRLGGLRQQARDDDAAEELISDPLALEDAGAFAVVLEAIPDPVAKQVTSRLKIPTIEILPMVFTPPTRRRCKRTHLSAAWV